MSLLCFYILLHSYSKKSAHYSFYFNWFCDVCLYQMHQMNAKIWFWFHSIIILISITIKEQLFSYVCVLCANEFHLNLSWKLRPWLAMISRTFTLALIRDRWCHSHPMKFILIILSKTFSGRLFQYKQYVHAWISSKSYNLHVIPNLYTRSS